VEKGWPALSDDNDPDKAPDKEFDNDADGVGRSPLRRLVFIR
jgi:hypothetical protein